MAYKPGIFQYGEFDLGNEDLSAYDQGPITNLPPFNVNEPPGFNNLNDLDLYNAGLSSGNIFYGGYVPGGGGTTPVSGTVGVQPPADDGGYKDPINIADYKAGRIGPEGYSSGRSESKPIAPSETVSLPRVEVPIGQQVEAGAGGYSDATNQNLFNQGLIGPAGYSSGTLPSVGLINPSATVNLPQVEVAGTKINDGEMTAAEAASLMNTLMSGVNPGYVPPSSGSSTTSSSGITTLAPVTAQGGYTDPDKIALYTQGLIGPANDPRNRALNPNVTTLPPVTAQGGYTDPDRIALWNEGLIGPSSDPRNRGLNPNVTTLPPVTAQKIPEVTPGVNTAVIPGVTPGITPGTTPASSAGTTPAASSSVVPSSTVFDPNTVNSGVGGYGTNAQTLTTKRDFGKELAESLAALKENQSSIMGMYGDLYKQFMPKGITDTESSIIDQYKTDLARLQQRQAGVLAPEDIRQSQQAAREAYGARGQVMGRGAVGAEIMGRENIRQQREDQARAGLQSSYGNIMKMADLQTGNLFSPIGNLMSNTFNPLSPYAADVYGTNVNAQLAKEIAQKNYDAAVRSAELSGAAQKSAATTSAAGSIFGPAVGGLVAKGLGGIFGVPLPSCMPGDQCIDTPTGPKAIKDLKGGDSVIGYDGDVAFIAQACSWNQNPLRTFLTITREDCSSFTVCDDHKIMGIPAMEWVEGAELAGSLIKSIEESTGLLTSYDILTNQGGYRINGIPVNSMIPEIVMQVVEFHRQVDRNLQAIST
jgi:hypothetical protein